MSTSKTTAQLRTENAELTEKLADAEVDLAVMANRARVLEDWLGFAEGFTFRLTNPHEMIRVQTNGYGRWAIFLNGRQRAGAWTGAEWGPLDAEFTEMYRWTLLEALSAAAQLAADDFAEYKKWADQRLAAEAPEAVAADATAADDKTAEAVAS